MQDVKISMREKAAEGEVRLGKDEVRVTDKLREKL